MQIVGNQHHDALGVVWLPVNMFSTIHRHFARTFVTCNVPKKGDRGWLSIYFLKGILTQVSVVVGMSGGVDSSVAALLLAKKVCQECNISKKNKCSFTRTLIFLLFLCGTGTLETNLAQTRDANGKEIGKTFNQSARNSISLVNLCVFCYLFFLSSLRFSLNFPFFFRLIYHRSIGIGFLNHR